MTEYIATIGNFEGQIHVLLHQEHARPGVVSDSPEYGKQLFNKQGCQSQAHLVDHEQSGVALKSPSDREHLLFTSRQKRRLHIDSWSKTREIAEDLFECWLAFAFSEPQILSHTEPEEESSVFGDMGHTAPGDSMSLSCPYWLAQYLDGSSTRRKNSRDREQGCRLSSSVRAEQCDNFSRVDNKGEISYNRDSVVTRIEVIAHDERFGHASLPVASNSSTAEEADVPK